MNVPIDVSGVTLQTERLLLRPWRYDDLEDFFAYASSPAVGPDAGWLPHVDREVTREILTMFIEEKKTFAIEYEGRVIGSIGVEAYNEEAYPELAPYRGREIGYALSDQYWGRGIMTEAVQEVIRYLFDEVGLDVIFCGNFLRNRRSARVQEKCGFRFCRNGTFRTQYGTEEETEDRLLWRKDYPS